MVITLGDLFIGLMIIVTIVVLIVEAIVGVVFRREYKSECKRADGELRHSPLIVAWVIEQLDGMYNYDEADGEDAN